MTALAARQQTLQLIDELPDTEMPRLLLFVQSLAPQTRGKSDKVRAAESLFGSLPSTVTVEEAKAARLEHSL